MSDFIVQATSLISKKFPDHWWDSYGFADESKSDFQQEFDLFKKNSEELKDQFFDLLNASALSGEYCKIDNFDQLLDYLSSQLDTIFSLMPPNEEVQAFLIENLNENFINCLQIGVKLYLNLFVQIKLKFEVDNRIFINDHNPEISNVLENDNFDKKSMRHIFFFGINLQVALIDIKMTPDEEDYHQLLSISEDLVNPNKLGGLKYSVLLTEKCDFLKTKWVLRQQHINSTSVYSIYNNKEVELTINDFNQNLILKAWRKYIESHYEFIMNWRAEIQRDFDILKNKKLSSLSLRQLHRLIKYFKDVNGDYSKLKEIRLEIQNRYEKLKDVPDKRNEKYAYSIALNYSINNEFSYLLTTEDVLNDRVINLYSEISGIQKSTGIKNFFAQYKYLNYLVRKLEELYDQRKALEQLNPLRVIINRCHQIIDNYRENVNWSENNYNYAFHLPYDECLIPTGKSEIPSVYIYSSFLLPLSADKYVPDFEENERKILTLNTSIEIFENLEKEISDFAEIRREIQARDIRSMEILGIFTAVVTFVAGSLPTFKYITTPYQAFLFMLALSTSLSVFVLVILTLSRGTDKLKQKINIISIILVLAILAWFFLILFTNDPIKTSNSL